MRLCSSIQLTLFVFCVFVTCCSTAVAQSNEFINLDFDLGPEINRDAYLQVSEVMPGWKLSYAGNPVSDMLVNTVSPSVIPQAI
jgi:hypothetical protein